MILTKSELDEIEYVLRTNFKSGYEQNKGLYHKFQKTKIHESSRLFKISEYPFLSKHKYIEMIDEMEEKLRGSFDLYIEELGFLRERINHDINMDFDLMFDEATK